MAAALPKAFRHTMKMGLETTRRGFETLMTANGAAWKAEERLPSSQGGIAVLVQEMTKLTRSNVDANLRVAERLTDAESAEQAFGLYVEYMQERMTALMGQWQEIGNLCARLAETPDAGETPAPRGVPAVPQSESSGSSLDPSLKKQADRTTNGSGTHKPKATRNPVRATQTKGPSPAASSEAASHRTAKRATPAQSKSPSRGSSKPKDRSSKTGRKTPARSRKKT